MSTDRWVTRVVIVASLVLAGVVAFGPSQRWLGVIGWLSAGAWCWLEARQTGFWRAHCESLIDAGNGIIERSHGVIEGLAKENLQLRDELQRTKEPWRNN